MTKQSSNPFQSRVKRSLSAIASTGLIASSGLWIQAKANESVEIPDAAPTAEAIAPEPIKLSAPQVAVPTTRSAPEPRLKTVPTEVPTIPPLSKQGQNSFIDTTSYSPRPKAPEAIAPPSQVILTERRSGCQTIAQNGQLSGRCGQAAAQPTTLATAKPLPPRAIASVERSLTRNASAARNESLEAIAVRRPVSQKVAAANTFRNNVVINTVVSLQPIARQGLNIALEPITDYSRATTSPYPVVPLEARHTDLLFPLPIVASISSVFGWRMHPVTGTMRMHEGTDIAAPTGTPVLAAYEGEVATADYLGGYGLTVILRHIDGTQESRYAHLSEIFVQPGEWVERGAVIGRVGSTGLSTGPHLHFEYRHLTPEGWVAVDAGQHLEYALENLLRSMEYAQLQPSNLADNLSSP